MLNRLARGIAHHPLITVIAWVAIAAVGVSLAVFGVTGQGLFDRVNSGAPATTDSESSRADAIVEAANSSGDSLTLIVSGVDLTNPELLATLTQLFAEATQTLIETPNVVSAVNPLNLPDGPLNPAAEPLLAVGGDGFAEVVEFGRALSPKALEAAVHDVEGELKTLAGQVEKAAPGAATAIGGGPMIAEAIVDQMEADLTTGEFVSLPIALVVMVIVFAGFSAACMPLFAALAAIAAALGAVFALTYLTDIHTSVINVITIVGVGLSIDYGLLIVSRFREELRSRSTGPGHRTQNLTYRALRATLATAGRTVCYSALTIAAAIAGLMAFRPSILRVFGAAGFIEVLIALLTAITLVPACLVLLGPRLAKPSVIARVPVVGRLFRHRGEAAPDSGVFSRLAAAVQAKPWFVIVAVLGILTALAWPVGHSQMRNSTVDLLAEDSAQARWLDQLQESYPATATPPITLVALGTPEQTVAFADTEVAGLDHVASATTVPRDGYVEVRVLLDLADNQGPEARRVVEAIRGLEPGFEVLATGPAAQLVDFMNQLGAGAPAAGAIVAATTLLLLFAMTGSVLIPIKALIANGLSLAACLGVVTWLFQDGHLAGLIGFTPMPGIESYIVVLLLIFGFGLAMDYEVFLISRIKEGWDAGLDSDAAVRFGLQRSGRIITSAALIIIVVFAGFAAGQLIIVKEIGVGLAIAVALDATFVRMLLVPATMTVLGRWNWWAPKWLARLHTRFNLTH